MGKTDSKPPGSVAFFPRNVLSPTDFQVAPKIGPPGLILEGDRFTPSHSSRSGKLLASLADYRKESSK
jgi:hypothetical protein